MNVVVNGQDLDIEFACNVSQLLDKRGLANTACAVEVNQMLVPKRRHQDHVLADGDRVEIVTLVGGG